LTYEFKKDGTAHSHLPYQAGNLAGVKAVSGTMKSPFQAAASLSCTNTPPSWKHYSHHYLFFFFLLLLLLLFAPIVVLSILNTRYNTDRAQLAAIRDDLDSNPGDSVFIFPEGDVAKYILWQYMGVIYAVCVGLVWELIDLTTRRR
jgi:hypothetical protein